MEALTTTFAYGRGILAPTARLVGRCGTYPASKVVRSLHAVRRSVLPHVLASLPASKSAMVMWNLKSCPHDEWSTPDILFQVFACMPQSGLNRHMFAGLYG